MRDSSTKKAIRKGWESPCRKRTVGFIIFISIAIGFAAIKGYTEPVKKKVFIQKPAPCHQLEKVDVEKVYLKSQPLACTGGSNPEPIEIEAKVTRVNIFVDGSFWREQEIVDINAIQGVFEKSKELEKTLHIPDVVNKEAGRAQAEALARQFASERFQSRLHQESERIKTEVFGIPGTKRDGGESRGGEETDPIKEARGPLGSLERIYLFVSSSMPLSTLRTYAADIGKLSDPNITMVMRGFVGGMKYAQPTLRLVSDITVKDPACRAVKQQCDAHRVAVNIDPLLFRKYQIDRVPALVYVPSFHEAESGASEGVGEASSYYVLYGDASLSFGIERIQKEAKGRSLKLVLSKLNQGISAR